MKLAIHTLALALGLFVGMTHAETNCPLSSIKVPEGYTVEFAAASPLVEHPLMACFDEQGRLYIAANAGKNLRREDLEKELPNYVQRLEDTNGDGVFDRSVVFADKMTFPQGCLWYRGSLYVASSGAIWKLTDTTGDGVADERVKLVGDFGYTGNAADVHGPFLGREGRIYWCEGRHGHEFRDAAGNVTSRGKAARIFSCLPDGSDVQTWCTGGMDNPVEIVFTPEGDMLGTVNLMYNQPRGDCLVHWQWGGVYPREDFVDSLAGEFYRTGELLREVHNFGHVALSGLCRYESAAFGDDVEGDLFITQFNTGKIIRTKLQRKGATYEVASNSDFLTTKCDDFHPTDVLEDADGSLLVIDTGGWFRIGCPESQVAKPDVHGAIYRIRKVGTQAAENSRRHNVSKTSPKREEMINSAWSMSRGDSPLDLNLCKMLFAPDRPMEVELAMTNAVASMNADRLSPEVAAELFPMVVKRFESPHSAVRVAAYRAASRLAGDRLEFIEHLEASLGRVLAHEELDSLEQHAIIFSLIKLNDREAVIGATQSNQAELAAMAAVALAQLRRNLTSVTDDDLLSVPQPELGQALAEDQRQSLLDTEAQLAPGDPIAGRAVYLTSKAACSKCHQIAGEGGKAGPDLTNIGARRNRRDLLESILYPNASFVRGFEPYSVVTEDGKVASGIIVGESAAAIRLAVDPTMPTEIPRDKIEEIKATNVSTMPGNVAEQLSPQELADLLAYLESLK